MRTIAYVSLAVACLGAPAAAMAAPNLSGEWKLNVARSKYGDFPAPASMIRKIKHEGVSLSMSTTQKGAQGEVTSELNYSTDGKAVVNKTATGEIKGGAHWEGNNLIIESSRQVNSAELKERDTWTLSADGKTLTVAAHIVLPQQGEFDVTQVFDKQ